MKKLIWALAAIAVVAGAAVYFTGQQPEAQTAADHLNKAAEELSKAVEKTGEEAADGVENAAEKMGQELNDIAPAAGEATTPAEQQ